MLLTHRFVAKINKENSKLLNHLFDCTSSLWEECIIFFREKKSNNLNLLTESISFKSLNKQTAYRILYNTSIYWKLSTPEEREKFINFNNIFSLKFKKREKVIKFIAPDFLLGDKSIVLSFHSLGLDNVCANYPVDIIVPIKKQLKNISFIEVRPHKDKFTFYITYYQKEPSLKKDNGHYLSIDLGLKNLFTCFDNRGGSFIISGSYYLNILYYYNKSISHYKKKMTGNVKHSKKIDHLYEKKQNKIEFFMHYATKKIVDYCEINDISCVIIGDLKKIRDRFHCGARLNQSFHSLPFEKIYSKLKYKLNKKGINFLKINESYSSKCPPSSPFVAKEFSRQQNRIHRGLYIDKGIAYNADCVGAFNIMRLYYQSKNKKIDFYPNKILNPTKKVSPYN